MPYSVSSSPHVIFCRRASARFMGGKMQQKALCLQQWREVAMKCRQDKLTASRALEWVRYQSYRSIVGIILIWRRYAAYCRNPRPCEDYSQSSLDVTESESSFVSESMTSVAVQDIRTIRGDKKDTTRRRRFQAAYHRGAWSNDPGLAARAKNPKALGPNCVAPHIRLEYDRRPKSSEWF